MLVDHRTRITQTRHLMGMPITVDLIDTSDAPATLAEVEAVYACFAEVDETFSPYKQFSQITRLNMGQLILDQADAEVRTVLALADQTRRETDGYFDIWQDGCCDPCGLVKGWAIKRAADLLRAGGVRNFCIEAGGDIQTAGQNADGDQWRIGLRNPFNLDQIVKVLHVGDCGIATSGTYLRGAHIYNPKTGLPVETDIVSLTVIAPNIYDADRFATAAFAMGHAGIDFIATLPDCEAYQIDRTGFATYTAGFERFTRHV